jgi:cysteine desulfurase
MIYLDYNATTPVDPHVLEAMLPYFHTHFGNAGSRLHAFGWAADEGVQIAREQVASLLNAEKDEIVFTGGATEALNMAIRGVAKAYQGKGKHLVTAKTEHKAVLETYADLEAQGFSTTYLDVDQNGLVSLEELENALTKDTILVSIMHANNETGVLQDVEAIYERAKAKNILFLTDATQAMGKVPVSVAHCDLLACSGHKFYAPKGVGALYIRRRTPRVRMLPFITGGGQERGLRGGTLNVPAIVGMGKAAQIAAQCLEQDAASIRQLRDQFEHALCENPLVHRNGDAIHRLPNTANLRFEGFRAAELLRSLTHLAASTGSACSTANPKPSHVLKAMHLTDAKTYASIRFSLGRFTTQDDIEQAIGMIKECLERNP